MTATIHLGHLRGVEIGLHWSVLGIVLLLLFGLGAGLLPAAYPGYSLVAYAVGAFLITCLFLGSLLAHEVSHAVVALREGMRVDGITLWLLGGVARLSGDVKTAGADFRIAGVGPLVSLVLALAFGALALLFASVRLPALVVGGASYLAFINGVLAVFNLVPAAPLDGGRVLRAALWAWSGDRLKATVWSARAGRVFGMALVVLGVLQLFTRTVGGLWWIFIGLFVVAIAGAEERQAQLIASLGGLRVRDVMTPDPDTAGSRERVAEFAHRAALGWPHATYPLKDASNGVIGLVTLTRIREVDPAERSGTTLARIACPLDEVPTATSDEPLVDLLARMNGCAEGRALVFENGALVGIVSPSDIARAAAWHGLALQSPTGGADLVNTPSPWGTPTR
ncbi:site-2 protease family protein [Saccharopolyspora elongata]|uniref:Zinc metalloprotease n=1 Tax=Saccharopolyspora elongata TaxID=2530387 RepID=A0A4R4ZB26_9PSEU|nr:site-2 protease family protein [Saccharopolyspora elongata]TDD55226.1 site-2 protease family protein [Saccharopolyspora elongata]